MPGNPFPSFVSSLRNELVGSFYSLHTPKGRKQHRAFLIEGAHLLQEALLAGVIPSVALFREDALLKPENGALYQSLIDLGVNVASVTEEILAKISDTQTPQGIAAMIPLSAIDPERARAARPAINRPLSIILDEIRDPGNMGAILRSALASNIDAIYLTPGCADIFSPKVVRSASGAIFKLPVFIRRSWAELALTFANHRRFYTEAGAETLYYHVDLTRDCVFVIGNEAHGPSAAARNFAEDAVAIPMANNVESLNAAIAASIIMFESQRQALA